MEVKKIGVSGCSHQFQFRVARKQGRDRKLHFQPRKRCADTEVQPDAKGQMLREIAFGIKDVRVFAKGRIAPRSAKKRSDFLTGLKSMSEDFNVFIDPPREHVQRRVKTQKFFDHIGRAVRRQ